MKILLLNFEKTWRGGERQTIYALKGLDEDHFHDAALLCRKGYPLEKRARELGFRTYAFDNVLGVLRFLMGKGRVFKILHAQTSQILTWCIIAKLFTNHKVIYTRRVDFIQKGYFTKMKYQLTDKLVAISNAVRMILNDWGLKNVEVIHSAVEKKQLDIERAKQILSSMNIEKGKRIIATTGALVSHKDPLTMIEAVKELYQKRQDFVFLHFGHGELLQQVQERIKKHSLENVYLLPGFRDDVEDYFSIMDVFVMSSKEEGLGSSVLDAFVYRVPVVSTDAGGLKDLLIQGENGWMCQKGNPKALAEGIDEVLNDKEMSEKFIDNAENFATEHFSIERMNRQYTVLYASMVNAKIRNR